MSESGASPQGEHYRVLARKYRPSSFEALIGQDAMVRTLRNGFAAGRIPHAWMLTGVRGVGKTTTARILARGLNFQREDKSGAPTVDFSETGVHCQAILEGRHPDVVEMDAASHTGIDDIRDIIDSARYVPVSAPYKVYIIDEVHMLSKAAFNGLLKTLEEPPEHVKFIFATTEIRKVPVTVLSRCQRFDLKRIAAEKLIAHLERIAESEGVSADADALRAIARASEGSVRDALSILDQAIAHGNGKIGAEAVTNMLGLADRTRIVDLFKHVMGGDTAAALKELQEQFDGGAEPHTVLAELADFTHYVMRLKVAPEAAAQAAVSETERDRGQSMAGELSVRVLAQTWQILLRGLSETATAAMPMASADMVLVRLCHAAGLPPPDEAIRALVGAGETASPAPAGRPVDAKSAAQGVGSRHSGVEGGWAAPAAEAAEGSERSEEGQSETVQPESFADLVALAKSKRDRLMVFALERQVRPVRFSAGQVEVCLTPDAEESLPQRLSQKLREWTGERWVVAVSDKADEPTLHEHRLTREQRKIEQAIDDPLVARALEKFPGAKVVAVREFDAAQDDDESATG